jgi:hypothetical protein
MQSAFKSLGIMPIHRVAMRLNPHLARICVHAQMSLMGRRSKTLSCHYNQSRNRTPATGGSYFATYCIEETRRAAIFMRC